MSRACVWRDLRWTNNNKQIWNDIFIFKRNLQRIPYCKIGFFGGFLLIEMIYWSLPIVMSSTRIEKEEGEILIYFVFDQPCLKQHLHK